MPGASTSFSRRFSGKAFFQGLLVFLVLYLGGFGVVWFQSEKTLERLSDRLVSQTVIIHAGAFPEKVTEEKEPDHSSEQRAADDPGDGHPAETDGTAADHSEHDESDDHLHEPEGEQDHGTAAHPAGDGGHDTAAAVPSNDPLAEAPLPGLIENTVVGHLPIKRESDGLSPFAAYARPYSYAHGVPKISVMIMDYGLSAAESDVIALMPGGVTPVLSPYSTDIDLWRKKARANGHEVWLEMPMETERFPAVDPGPQAIRSTALLLANEQILNWVLSRTSGYSGLVGYYDDRFIEAQIMLAELMRGVFERGLGYVETNRQAHGLIKELAEKHSSPYALGDMVIDAPVPTPKLAQDLALLEARAQRLESAILVVKPYPQLLAYLQGWMKGLDAKGIALAPLSAATGHAVAGGAGAAAPAEQADDGYHGGGDDGDDHH